MRYRDALRWSLIAIAIFLMGPTWPRDDTGTPAPPCYWIRQSTGALVACSELDPLPTGAGTSSGTDPTGWGKNWFAASGLLSGTRTAALFTSDLTVQAWHANAGGTAIDVRASQSGGRAFTLTESGAGDTCPSVNTALRISGTTLVGCNGSGVDDGMFRSVTGLETWTRLDLPSTTGAAVQALAAQGTTVLAAAVSGANFFICRSTNSGSSFGSCTDFAQVTQVNPLGITSPTGSTWLVKDSAGVVSRSTDDGGTWTNVLTGLNTSGGVECLSATVCLATDGVNVRRSTDAGATWTTISVAATGTVLLAFVDFGSQIVVALSGSAAYRSADLGITWVFQVTLPLSASVYTVADTRNGRGIIGGDMGGGNQPLFYSPIVGTGETIVAGQNGARWDINASGQGGVYQGAAAAVSGAWPIKIVDSAGVNVAAVNASGQLSVVAAASGNVTLQSPASNGPGTFTSAEVTGFAAFQRIVVMCDVTSFITATSLDVYIQRRQDSAIPTTRWTDIAHFTQFTATGTRFARFSSSETPGVVDEALQDATLAAATVKQGPWTDGWRVKFVIVGASASVNFNCMAHRN